jgi:hypothetical protein
MSGIWLRGASALWWCVQPSPMEQLSQSATAIGSFRILEQYAETRRKHETANRIQSNIRA